MRQIAFGLFICLSLMACATLTLSPTSPPTISTLPLNQVPLSISIQDDWSGYNQVSPTIAHFTLEHVDDQFVGTAYYSVGGHFGDSISTTEGITIPANIVSHFVQVLQNTPLEKDAYIIPPTRTDDFPVTTISIETENGFITFFQTLRAQATTLGKSL